MNGKSWFEKLQMLQISLCVHQDDPEAVNWGKLKLCEKLKKKLLSVQRSCTIWITIIVYKCFFPHKYSVVKRVWTKIVPTAFKFCTSGAISPVALSHFTRDSAGECGLSFLWLPETLCSQCVPGRARGEDRLFSAPTLQCCPVPIWLTAQFEGGRKALCRLWMTCQSQLDQLLLLRIVWVCVRVCVCVTCVHRLRQLHLIWVRIAVREVYKTVGKLVCIGLVWISPLSVCEVQLS